MILRAIDPMKHHPLSTSRANESIASRTGAALSVGAQALGSLALGALAVGALALGAVAIGRLVIGRARKRRVEIDELVELANQFDGGCAPQTPRRSPRQAFGELIKAKVANKRKPKH